MDQYLLIPFLGGWTSINPSYFDVNYRGTRFWHTAIWLYMLFVSLSVFRRRLVERVPMKRWKPGNRKKEPLKNCAHKAAFKYIKHHYVFGMEHKTDSALMNQSWPDQKTKPPDNRSDFHHLTAPPEKFKKQNIYKCGIGCLPSAEQVRTDDPQVPVQVPFQTHVAVEQQNIGRCIQNYTKTASRFVDG